jgi:hypothetical protein
MKEEWTGRFSSAHRPSADPTDPAAGGVPGTAGLDARRTCATRNAAGPIVISRRDHGTASWCIQYFLTEDGHIIGLQVVPTPATPPHRPPGHDLCKASSGI